MGQRASLSKDSFIRNRADLCPLKMIVSACLGLKMFRGRHQDVAGGGA